MNGFTLIEMIVVVAVVAILMGTITISVDSLNEDVRLSNAANRAQADVRYAHEMAMMHRREVDVVVSAGSDSYDIQWHDDGTYLTSSNDDSDLSVQFATGEYSDVTISSSNIGSRLSFSSTGAPLIDGSSFSGDRSVMLLNSRMNVYINDAGLTYLSEVEGASGCGW